MQYQFEYKLTEQDYWDFNEFYLNNSNAIKIKFLDAFFGRRWLSGSFTLLLAVFMLLLGRVAPFIVMLALAAMCFYGINRFGINISIAIMKSRIKKDGKLPFGRNCTLRFDDDCFVSVADEVETKMKYAIIEKILCSHDTAYIFINAAQAEIIPFSVFEDENQRVAFLEFVSAKAGVVTQT